MRTGKAGIQLIKWFEGLRLDAYLCPAGKWTIGYGHTRDVHAGMRITEEQADALLRMDLGNAETEVNKIPVELNQNQFDALVSFVFNVGTGAFRRSTARRLIITNPADPEIEKSWVIWKWAGGKILKGLENRRKAEVELYYKPVEPAEGETE